MFGWLQYEFNAARLQRDRQRVVNAYKKDYAEAKAARKSSDELAQIEATEMFEVEMIDDELRVMQTHRIQRQASWLDVPVPPAVFYGNMSKDWIRTRSTGEIYLSPSAYADLRAAIRTELKERREQSTWWVPLAVGIIGALIGLASALKPEIRAPIIVRPTPVVVQVSTPGQHNRPSNFELMHYPSNSKAQKNVKATSMPSPKHKVRARDEK
jgi:hypothetical protein